jgi:uncharacterized protein YndB with AHSA1/START domain
VKVTQPDDTAIVIQRPVAAPPEKVWRAHTEPEHLRRWLGRADFPLTRCEMDVRVGGHYRWVFTESASGAEMGVSGRYEVVERPVRLVNSEKFDDFPGPSTNSLELAAQPDGATLMTITVRYADRATRDGWLTSGMTDGMAEGFGRLDELLAALD